MDARTYVRIVNAEQTFCVIADDIVVGVAGMHEGTDPIEIGYWIGRIYWGRGYATGAVGLIIDEARCRKIARLVAHVFPGNTASLRVLEKNGFTREGAITKDLPQRGGPREVIRFLRFTDTA